jgi:hypothetical protein
MIEPVLTAAGGRVHYAKSWSKFFKDIITGDRLADLRFNDDREFRVGDYLCLGEWDPLNLEWTNRACLLRITYIQRNDGNPCALSHQALSDNYDMLSIRLLEWWENASEWFHLQAGAFPPGVLFNRHHPEE